RLRAALHRDRLTDAEVRDVADLAAAGHYQVACTRHLEAKLQRRQKSTVQNQDAPAAPVTSPNQFFDMCNGVTASSAPPNLPV
ncbi:hypothetical protein IW139_004790, partial [Coemansia sp. RSA 353]